nr:SwmB domain-containing protein [Massilia endophytica]
MSNNDGNGRAGTLTFNSAYGDIDEIRFSFSSASTLSIDDIDVSVAVPDTTAPVFSSAAVNGTSLVMTYTEASMLDAANAAAAGAFTVMAGGSSVTVNSVAVNAAANTVTLTLASAVTHGQAVTVAYTDPTGGDDTNAIQDVAGNDAATLGATAVTNNTPDTTAPAVTGNISVPADAVYAEGQTLSFTVTFDENVTVSGTDSSLALTIGSTARSASYFSKSGATVTYHYTVQAGDLDANGISVGALSLGTSTIQDAAGNNATLTLTGHIPTLTGILVDTAAPVFASAVVNGTSLVLTYTDDSQLDAGNGPIPGHFNVEADGATVTISSVSVNAAAKTVTLTLASAVAFGQAVTVAYADGSPSNDPTGIQDAAGNDAASLSTTAVTNNTPDITAPVFASATVNGASLVLAYNDASTLDAVNVPAAGDFAVTVGGSARAVNSVSVDAAAKTITLTLASAAGYAEAVTVAYTDPTAGNDTNAIQDAAGNDAASLGVTPVTNNTPDTTAPVFASAAVNGTSLVMTYTEATTLNGVNVAAAGAFTVMAGGSPVTVNSVSVNAAAKTVTLTLATAVGYAEAVTVAYTDPTGGNDANAIQDAAGNDAATLGATAVTNNTPDTTGPVFASAEVNGSTLVMTYTEATTLDAVNAPAAGAFTVMAGGSAVTVNSVSVNAAAKTVTLTLASAVANGQAVTVAYADPTGGNDANAIQDAAGNDAATLGATAVTNNTPDTTAPALASAAVNGTSLVLTYTDVNTLDAVNTAAAGDFTVMAGGSPVTVNSVTVNAGAKTVTLTLASAVNPGESVTVAYSDPTGGNDANATQDAAGNDAASFGATAVTNNTPDATAPVFASAAVDGATLVMTYTEATTLDGTNVPAAGAFTVMAGGSAVTVNSVAVDANAKTVTLTLASAVITGQAVTVAYNDPTGGDDSNAIQDIGGNDAATLGATAVTNNTVDTTAPVFASAAVNGTSLVMTYTEATTLDAGNAPAAGRFTVMAGGSAVTVNSVSVDAAAKTVTLTLASGVVAGQAVTVAYADPTGGNDANAIQDASGNDAVTLSATTVTNNTPDVAAPVFASAAVNGASLVMTYTDASQLDAGNPPAIGDFAVMAGGSPVSVSSVSVNAAAKTVTLTLASAVTPGQAVTVAYTDPTIGNDGNAIQDAAGNDAITLGATAVTNNTPDVTAPVFASAAVNGATLVLTYTEATTLDATNVPAAGAFTVMAGGSAVTVSSVSVNAAAKTVTLTLASAVAPAQAVTVAYADPTGGNDTNAIQDAAGNDAATLGATSVTNNTVDTTAPVFASAAVNGTLLVMTYTEASTLDGVNAPAAGAFTVTAGGSAVSVSSVSVNAAAKTVTLTLASGVTAGQAVTVAYADPTGGNDTNAIQDAAGNDAITLAATAATNNTPDVTAPVFASATVNGTTLVMTYTEAVSLDAVNGPAAARFAVTAAGSAVAVSNVVVDANAKTVTLTLATAVTNGQAVTVAYTDPTGGNDANAIQDAAGNDAVTLGATAVTNNTPVPSPSTPPTTSTVDGVAVQTGTVANSDGSVSTVVTIPVVTTGRVEEVGDNTVADIPLVKNSSGTSLLTVQVPVGVGLQASGPGQAKTAGSSLTDLIREIKAHTTSGSADQNSLTGGGTGFLGDLQSSTPLLVQTVVTAGNTPGSNALTISGQPTAAGETQVALVIDTRSQTSGVNIELQNVEFAAIIGTANVSGGSGSQKVWGDSASQTIFLGADDDVLHGGGGNDTVGSAGGNDRVYGDEGNDIVFGGEGDDYVDGGTGLDIARFSGRSDAYSLRMSNDKLVMTAKSGTDGVDTVVSVETLRFIGGQGMGTSENVLARLYEGLLHRSASAAEVAFWQDKEARGATMHDIAASIAGSTEAVAVNGASNLSFVTGLYQNVLGRAASSQEADFWLGKMAGGMDRATVALGFVNSTEKLAAAVNVDFNHSDVAVLVRMYNTMFGRAADEAGLNYWLAKHEQGMTMGAIADAFTTSSEAQALQQPGGDAAFINQLYLLGMHRAPTAAESLALQGLMQQGVFDRGQVLLNVAESAESITLVGTINTSIDLA